MGTAMVNENIDDFKDMIRGDEGLKLSAYRPGNKPNEPWTIGVGQTGDAITKNTKWSKDYAEKMFDKTLRSKLSGIRKEIPKFNSFPRNVQSSLLSSWYRGSLSGSPKTIELINDERYGAAGEEFLINDEYDNAVAYGIPGIRGRMERSSRGMAEMGNKQDMATRFYNLIASFLPDG